MYCKYLEQHKDYNTCTWRNLCSCRNSHPEAKLLELITNNVLHILYSNSVGRIRFPEYVIWKTNWNLGGTWTHHYASVNGNRYENQNVWNQVTYHGQAKSRTCQISIPILRLLFSDPTFYKWGRKIMICDAFFPKFCQISTISTFWLLDYFI